MTVRLRPYQQDLVEAVFADWKAGERSVAVELPTGGGKTVVFADVVRRVREAGGRSLVAVHREELVDQAVAKVRDALGPAGRIGRVQGAAKQTRGVDVAVGMVQTMATPGGVTAVEAGRFGAFVIDECHHAAAPTYRRAIAAAGESAYVLGVTATLRRSDGLALGEVFGKISYVKSITSMIREGWLVRPRGRHVFVEGLDLRRVRRRGGDFSDGALAAAMMDAMAPSAIVRAWQEHASDRRTIGFAPTVEMAYMLAEAFRKAGVTSRAVHGDQSAQGRAERREAVSAYRRGEIQVLWNVGVLTEGFDAPETDCVVMARPTSSDVLFTQCIGRGLRTAPGKVDCLVLDVVGVLGRHKLATLASLAGAASPEELDGDLLGYEDDLPPADDEEISLAGESAGAAFLPEFVDGQLSWTEIELFEDSAFNWLRTRGGTPFILHDKQVIFPVLKRDGGVLLATTPIETPGGQLSGDVYPDIPEAMLAVERWLDREGTYVRRGESWRKNGRPTDDQERKAAAWRVHVSEGMTRGDVSDAINIAMASQRIDHLKIVTEGI